MPAAISIAAFAFVMGASWLALLLAEFGKFSAWPCLLSGLLSAGIAWFATSPSRRLSDSHFVTVKPVGGIVAACIALATLVFTLPPGEPVLGGWDPGVYAQTAAHISRTGELLINEPDLRTLTPDESAILTRTTSGIVGPFAGMWTLPDGRLSPQFHHLYPSLMAVAFSFGGLKAALMVNPLLNIGCIIAIYALARRFVRTGFALAAAVILALNPAQIWQAKFCTAEMLGQFLLLGGAIFFLDALAGSGAPTPGERRRDTVSPVLAGAAFGLAMLARYDSIIFLAPMFAMMIAMWRWLPDRRNALIVAVSFAPFLVHHLIHHHFFAPYYQPVSGLVLKAIAACVLAAFVFALAMRNAAARELAERNSKWIRALAALGVLAWWGFVWLRPQFPKAPLIGGPDSGNLYFLVAIFGPLVALFAIAQVVWVFSERNVARAIWLYASTAVLMVVTTSVFNDHFLMWVARRFVPVALPLLVLAAAKVAERIVRGRAGIHVAPSSKRRAIAFALLFGAVAANFPATRAMARLRDWPGLADWTARVAAAIPDDARIFCDQWGFAAPLRFVHGKKAFDLHLSERDKKRRDRLATVMAAAAKRGEKVFFLTTGGPIACDADFAKRGDFPLRSHKIDGSKSQTPRAAKATGGDFVLYELRAR